MSKIINVGRVTAYADAVKGGYQGTREEWEIVLANLGTTAAEVEANRQAVAEDKAAVEGDVTTVGEYKDVASAAAAAALQSAESAHTDALAATAAKEAAQTAQGIAEEAMADAAASKTAAESAQTEANASASAATEAALASQNAAETATANAGAASDSATAAAQSAEAAAESARTLTIDTTLTQAGQAADAKKVGDEVADLKSAVDDITGNTIYNGWSEKKLCIYTDASTADISSPHTEIQDFRYIVVPCQAGDTFTVTAVGGNHPRAWAFIDESGNVLLKADINATVTKLLITAPPNSSKLVVNDSSLAGSVYANKLVLERFNGIDDKLGTIAECVSVNKQINYAAGRVDNYISPTTLKWSTYSHHNSGLYAVPNGAEKIMVTANESKNAYIAFLRSNAHKNDTTPNWATGETGPRVSYIGMTNTYVIPQDCTYVYIYLSVNESMDIAPESTYFVIYKETPSVDATLKQSGDAADAKATGDKFEKVINLEDESLQFTLSAASGSGISWKTGVQYNSNFYVTDYIDVRGYDEITYKRVVVQLASAPAHGMAFYNEGYSYVSGVKSAYGADREAGYEDYITAVPNDAVYARFTVRDPETYGQFSVFGNNKLKSNINKLISGNPSNSDNIWMAGLIGLTQKTNGEFNVAARMRMLCDIEWTPINPVPRQRRVNGKLVYDSFQAGKKQRGIPYGAQLTYEQWMGKNISFETFLSALANPNSVMYNFSRVGTEYRASAWYSVNCSKAVVFALNLKNTYASGSFVSDPHINVVANAGQYTADDIHIGDIIESLGVHTALITDLVYNSFGELSQIEVSEAVTPTCRRKRWNIYGTFENFFDHFAEYRLERYDYIDDVPPVNMEAMHPYISPSIGLDYGSKSNYTTSDTIGITLLDKVSNTLVVNKDGTEVDTIDVTNVDQYAIVEYTQATPGWYEVGFDGDDTKNYVGFCVNDNVATFDSETNRLTFSSSVSTLFMVSYSAGSSRSHISDVFPTATDLTNGYMTLTVPNSANYIHVTFANDYGKTIVEIAV